MSLKYKILAVIFPVVFLLDQLTKWLVRSRLALGEYIAVIPGYFDIVHVANKGAAFGMFSGAASSFRIPFFYIVSVFAVIIIIVAYARLPAGDKLFAVIFSLILAGIAGNIVDRIFFGQVTDFLSFHIYDNYFDKVVMGYRLAFPLEWPAFNVADSAITAAMILLIISLFRPVKKV